ncbi:MAG TPA: HEAT repeat domain-containing protein [Gemmataceae bacterium]|nr:HEAT repeat domain-containing protein [Gemmataceae bacterium]
MRQATISFWSVGCFAVLLTISACPLVPMAFAAADDERILRDAGLSSEGPALVAFFHARARTDIDHESLHRLLDQLVSGGDEERVRATEELLGLGSLALQVLRQTVNDLDHPDAADRAAQCLPWLEGPASHQLLTAAAHLLAQRKPEGAAAALLAYLPYADNPEVVAAVTNALAAVAAPAGKPDPALLRGLSDRVGVRRAAACASLCRAVPPEQVPEVRKLLKDPSAKVRLRAAKALSEAKDAEAIPVLIDLLAEVSAAERQPVEELLKELAGEWAPELHFASDDAISRGVRRDAWASWWRRTDGPALLAALAQHTLTPDKRRRLQQLLTQLGSDDFAVRESASRQLLAFGQLALPRLREAVKDRDTEVSRRAKMLIERIENGPDVRLPMAALRLLAVRKPAGAVEALLAYLPFAEDELREEEVRKSLVVLARRDGKLDAALRHALADAQPKVRAIAAEALIAGGGAEGRAAVRMLVKEDAPSVRLRVALALTRAGEREGVSVLIELLPLLSAEECGQAEEALYQLAGDTAPQMPEGAGSNDKKKCRDAWAAWWKVNANRVDLARIREHASLGYTLILDYTVHRVYEIDRKGKQCWSIDLLKYSMDAVVLPSNRVLIAEFRANRVTERDFKGKILWQKEVKSPVSVQRLPNGNTFIAFGGAAILEIDRAGKEVYKITNIPKLLSAYRMSRGTIVCLTDDNQCRLLERTGKEVQKFAVKYPTNHSNSCLDVQPRGRILITSYAAGKVMEYDRHGNLLREWDVPNVSNATGLPNGHILATCSPGLVLELDRTGKIVWKSNQGKPSHVFRARRR